VHTFYDLRLWWSVEGLGGVLGRDTTEREMKLPMCSVDGFLWTYLSALYLFPHMKKVGAFGDCIL
jgi:hypothetical protein